METHPMGSRRTGSAAACRCHPVPRQSRSAAPAAGRGSRRSPGRAPKSCRPLVRKNPKLRVFSANGYFDLATPFFATEYDLGHMSLPVKLMGNVEFGYYPAGHMVYLNVDALKEMKADLAKFYSSAVHN